jgi:hypothetical protein
MAHSEGMSGHMVLHVTYWHYDAELLPGARRCITTGVGRFVRRVFMDASGRAVATGWFTKGV